MSYTKPKYYKVHTDGHEVALEPIYEELVPVVRGRWIKKETNSFCSECGTNVVSWSGDYEGYERERSIDLMHYCPNCGAKMDLEVKL